MKTKAMLLVVFVFYWSVPQLGAQDVPLTYRHDGCSVALEHIDSQGPVTAASFPVGNEHIASKDLPHFHRYLVPTTHLQPYWGKICATAKVTPQGLGQTLSAKGELDSHKGGDPGTLTGWADARAYAPTSFDVDLNNVLRTFNTYEITASVEITLDFSNQPTPKSWAYSEGTGVCIFDNKMILEVSAIRHGENVLVTGFRRTAQNKTVVISEIIPVPETGTTVTREYSGTIRSKLGVTGIIHAGVGGQAFSQASAPNSSSAGAFESVMNVQAKKWIPPKIPGDLTLPNNNQ